MSEPIVVYGFETSNNMKVRVALGYKGLSYSFQTINPGDRAEILRLSGQYLTPVLVHGENVTFDSSAILRYLDVHFESTPKLYGGSVQEQWAIEDWELFGRKVLADPMMAVVHTKISGGVVSDELKSRCQDEFHAAVEHIVLHMEGREWLVGGHWLTASLKRSRT